MEAKSVRSLRASILIAATAFPAIVCPAYCQAASARTQNFIVSAPNKALAQEIAQTAERFRRELAVEWLGHELPDWREPCPVRAKVAPNLGAGGATSFLFETEVRQFARPTGDGLFQAKPAGRPFGWEMTVQGSRERILDSVLPHEVTHTIFATHFGRPLPRWADEGACTTVEHDSEKQKQHRMLYEFLTTERGIAFNRMFAMTEYPEDILPLYSQGYSLARFFIQQGGRRKFVDYVGEGLDTNNWTAATKKHYGFDSISDLQLTWLDWVRGGSRELPKRNDVLNEGRTLLAANSPRGKSSFPQPIKPTNKSASFEQASNKQSGSWYAQQKDRPQKRSQKQADVADGRTYETAARPTHKSQTREVLLEWGQPSPFLNPRLVPTGGSVPERRAKTASQSDWQVR